MSNGLCNYGLFGSPAGEASHKNPQDSPYIKLCDIQDLIPSKEARAPLAPKKSLKHWNLDFFNDHGGMSSEFLIRESEPSRC